MINNGGKSGGNPYHDENGHFTSKGNQGSGNASQKVNQNTGNQPVDFAASIWNDFLKSQEQPKKTTGEKVLNQMGLTNEEVMEKHEEMSDEKALNDLGDKMDKLEEDIEYDDIDADYERSYGPVNTPEKYEAYQKWLENGHSFDNIGGEEEQVKADANYLKEHELESTKDLAPWDKPDEPDPEHDAKVDNALQGENKVLSQMGLSEKPYTEPRKDSTRSGNYSQRFLSMNKDKVPEVKFEDAALYDEYTPARITGINTGDPEEWEEKYGDFEMDVGSLIDELSLFNYMTDEESNKIDEMYKTKNFDLQYISNILDEYLDKALDDYNKKKQKPFTKDYYETYILDDDSDNEPDWDMIEKDKRLE